MSTTETKTEAIPMDTKIEQSAAVQEPNPKGEDSESDGDSEDENGDPKRCWICRKKWSNKVVQSEEAEMSCVKCDKKKREKGWCDGCGNHKLNKVQRAAGDTLCLVCWRRILAKNPNTREAAEMALVHWKPMIQRAAAGAPVWYQGVWM